jgi:outer membrane protein assembly factor BamC
MKFFRWLLILAIGVALGACQTLEEKRRIDYGNTRTLPPLEVPPDLASLPETATPPWPPGSAGQDATYSALANAQSSPVAAASPAASAVLPEFPGLRLARDGRLRYLVVEAPPQRVWPRLREFVLSVGLLVDREIPAAGILETNWAENRADVGTYLQRKLADWLGSLYSAGTRDKYRFWLERGTLPGTTEIYVAHLGMEEVVPSDGSSGPVTIFWQRRPSDPSLEIEMLHRLMVYLGAKEEQAKSEVAKLDGSGQPAAAAETARARLSQRDGRPFLSLEDSLERAWRRVGLSLDRIGFTVEDRDRSRWVFYVRYLDPEQASEKPGFLSRLFGSTERKKDEGWQYQIKLVQNGVGTAVEVLDRDGVPQRSKTAERILSLLYEQLK